jgi:hypothetical protein
MADKTQNPFLQAIKRNQINYETWCSVSHMQRTIHEMKPNLLLRNLPAAHEWSIEKAPHEVWVL